jgi:hypothetical protein
MKWKDYISAPTHNQVLLEKCATIIAHNHFTSFLEALSQLREGSSTHKEWERASQDVDATIEAQTGHKNFTSTLSALHETARQESRLGKIRNGHARASWGEVFNAKIDAWLASQNPPLSPDMISTENRVMLDKLFQLNGAAYALYEQEIGICVGVEVEPSQSVKYNEVLKASVRQLFPDADKTLVDIRLSEFRNSINKKNPEFIVDSQALFLNKARDWVEVNRERLQPSLEAISAPEEWAVASDFVEHVVSHAMRFGWRRVTANGAYDESEHDLNQSIARFDAKFGQKGRIEVEQVVRDIVAREILHETKKNRDSFSQPCLR